MLNNLYMLPPLEAIMTERTKNESNQIYSVGTQVVTLANVSLNGRVLHPAGSVAIVQKSPSSVGQAYKIRFLDGLVEAVAANQVVQLSSWKQGDLGDASTLPRSELFERVIYRCVIGSRAYGLETEQSDTDYRGIYLPPADAQWSLYGVPEQLECEQTQEAYWELQKFIVLALKSNPNILECLYSPLVEKATPLAEELLAMREAFLSKLVYQTFSGYVASQFKKMQADLRNHGAVKWKHVMHLLRLLTAGVQILQEHTVPVRVESHRELLLDIRAGNVPWEETEQLRNQLHTKFEDAFRTTTLPDRPDYEKANRFLQMARRAALKDELP